jgi:hypothetical protein
VNGPNAFQQFGDKLRAFMNSLKPASEEQFNALALELFALQYEWVSAYRTWCAARRSTPDRVRNWREIPAVPAEAFKEYEFSSIPLQERSSVFLSSGTTALQRSRNYHCRESLALYEASLIPWFAEHVLPESTPAEPNETASDLTTFSFLSLTPPGNRAPQSSLVHMFEIIQRHWDFGAGAFLGQVDSAGGWTIDPARCVSAIAKEARSLRPVVLVGAAFSFVALLDHLAQAGNSLPLPAGSRILETGGYKGRSRAVAKDELHALIGQCLGIGTPHIISEYGMCELSSQAYSGVTGQAALGRPFFFPPWARVQVVSPETGLEVADGQVGLVRIFDLANVYSVLAVQTADLAIRRGSGFQLLGRAPEAEPRGCSLMVGSLVETQAFP